MTRLAISVSSVTITPQLAGVSLVESESSGSDLPLTIVQDEAAFLKELSKLKPGEIAVVYFSATWCDPCKDYSPIFQRLAEGGRGRARFIVIESAEIEWMTKWKVYSYPTIKLFTKTADGKLASIRVIDDQDPLSEIPYLKEGRDGDAYFLGNKFLSRGRYQEAIGQFLKQLEIRPNCPTTLNDLGVAYARTGNLAKAFEFFSRAAKIKPNDPLILGNMGKMMDQLGESERALSYYEQAIKFDPDNADLYNSRGNANTDLKRYEAALLDFQEAIRRSPNTALFYANRAEILRELGDRYSAERDYRTAMALDPHQSYAKGRLLTLRLIPRSFDFSMRLPRGNKRLEPRGEFGATWRLFNLSGLWGLEGRLQVGHGGSEKDRPYLAGADLALAGGIISLEGGVGYLFPESVDTDTQRENGGYFRYGARIRLPLQRPAELGLSLLVEHDLTDPSRRHLTPGLNVSFDLW